jgi:hypothetical protein
MKIINRRLVIIICFVFTIINSYLVYRFLHIESNSKAQKEVLEIQDESQILLNEFDNNSIALSGIISSIKLYNGVDSICISEVLGNKYSILYCFSSSDCHECISEEINLLNDIFPIRSVHSVNIIMQSSESFNQLNKAIFGNRYFETKNNILPILRKQTKSFFLVVDAKTMQIGLLFYPNKYLSKRTINYLLLVKRRFFN